MTNLQLVKTHYSLQTKIKTLMLWMALMGYLWPGQAVAAKFTLANLCETKDIVVHEGDSILTAFKQGSCVDKFNSGIQPGQFHCESVTKIYPADPGQLISLDFLANYIIGYPTDKIITGRLMILDGIVDVPMVSTSCDPNSLSGTPDMGGAEVLFDSYIEGSRFSTLTTKHITGSKIGGGLTVVVLLFSTDLGSFPFTISMDPAPNVECQLVCLDKVNISLDQACGRRISPFDVDITCVVQNGVNRYAITLNYPNRYLEGKYGPDSVSFELAGQTFIYKLMDIQTGNSCWGHLTVEDKYPPQVNHKPVDTIACLDDSYEDQVSITNGLGCEAHYGPGTKFEFLSKRYEDFGCNNTTYPNFIGRVLREYRISDLWNNSRVYKDTIYLWRVNLTNVICPPDTAIDCNVIVKESTGTYKDILWSDEWFYTGTDGYRHPYPTEYSPTPKTNYSHHFPAPGIWYQIPNRPRDTVYLTEGDVFGSHGKCNIVYKYDDMVFPICGGSYKIRRTWLMKDWCTTGETTCVQWIKISDTLPPTIERHDHLFEESYDHLASYFFLDKCITDININAQINHPPPDCVDEVIRDDRMTPYDKVDDRYCSLDLYPHCQSSGTVTRDGSRNGSKPISVLRTFFLFKDKDASTDPGFNKKDPDEHYILHHVGKFSVNEHECSAHVTFPDFRSWLAPNSCDKNIDVFYTVEYADPSHPGKIITQHGKATTGAFIYLPAGTHWVLINFRDECWNESFYWWRVKVYDVTPPTPICDEHTVVTLDPDTCWARVYAKDLDDGSHDNCCQHLHFAAARMEDVEYWTTYWEDLFHNCLGEQAFYAHKADGTIDEAINEWINSFVFKEYLDLNECGTDSLVMRVFEACDVPHYDQHVFGGTAHHWFMYNLSDNFALWYDSNYIVGQQFYGDIPHATIICSYDGGIFTWKWSLPATKKPFKYPTRIKISTLWNDCMVEVDKQDKIAPVCAAPESVTVYCDGVPWEGTIWVGLDQAHYKYADDAWQFCSTSDTHTPGCYLDDKKADEVKVTDPLKWCYKGGEIKDHHGHFQGYYGGPAAGHYESGCEAYNSKAIPKPFYCRLWLLLDQFDDSTGARVDVLSYLAEDTDIQVKECSGYTISHDDSGALDECGSGTITRTWTVTEVCDPGRSTYCYQKVHIKRRSDFEVCFPADTTVTCDKDISILNNEGDPVPVISDDDCELIGINYEDQILDINGSKEATGCRQILRRWTIIDWCVYNPDQKHHQPDVVLDDRMVAGADRLCVIRCLKDDGDGYMEYLQIINIVDEELPEVLCNIGAIEACNYSAECSESEVNILLGFVNDNCTPKDKLKAWFRLTHENTHAVINGTGTRYIGPLSVGRYLVTLWGEDLCSNRSSCEFSFEVKDCKAPTPYCRNGVATVVMPSTGMVDVWASDLNANSFDNCTDQDDLVFSFDEEGKELSRVFTCDDIPDGQKEPIEVQVWVHDAAGNKDFCATYILLQDGVQNACPDGVGVKVDDNSILTSNRIGFPQGKQTGPTTIELRDAPGSSISALYQNLPNPFKSNTVIGFSLAYGGKATLKITDLSGKTIREVQGNYSSGYHEVQIDKLEIKGVMYYQLISGEEILTKKMINID